MRHEFISVSRGVERSSASVDDRSRRDGLCDLLRKGAEPTMICENCQKNEAVVHLTDIVNNTKKEYRLCKECAGIHGVSIQAQIKKHKQFTLPDFYSDPDTSTGSGRGDAADQECSQCGMSYSLFRKEGKFGCSHDYQCFRSELDSLLEKIHASSQHLGRTPGRFRKQVSSRAQLTQLREELSNAISDEQYEKAAAIRDQMRNLESQR